MKKIGIITLNGYFNYGNRLQNFALQQVLTSLGFYVETVMIDNSNKLNENKSDKYINKFKKLKGKTLLYLLRNIKQKILSFNLSYENENLLRKTTFKDFTTQHINETNYSIWDDVPKNLASKYDYFVVGSDQVWNPNYIHDLSVYFLAFAPIEKRISYAASFGVSNIPREYMNTYQKWLGQMKHMSVREEDGAKIIKDLLGEDVPVHVDPTLLLTKEQWLTISKSANNKPKGKYLLTYFLGKISEEYKNQIQFLAKKNKLAVINLADIRDKKTYTTGPSEFIDYINDCIIFCTDSFHGAVFSILLEKPFIVYERLGETFSMYSRINTLLNKFQLDSRRVECIKTDAEAFTVDFSHVPDILEKERNKSLDYLKYVLDKCEG